jgi:predicted regulator of Ras-like GTPase activity (Roadblock/LC7/MglB family)
MAQGTSTQRRGRGKALDDLLNGLIRASRDFEGAVLVSLDGLMYATAWSPDDQTERLQALDDSDVGAVACRAFAQSGEATRMLERGDLDRLILAGSHGNLIITRAGEDALCVALLKPEAKLGVTSFEAKRISAEIAQVLG